MKKFQTTILLLLCSITLLFVFAQSSAKADSTDEQTQQQLQEYLRDHNINGIILVNGKGSQPTTITNNVTSEKDKLVRADHLFPTASLQKIITGTATYNLKKQNKFGWDTSIHKYFPQIDASNDITIRELMNHTSGLINNDRPFEPLKGQKQQIAYMLKHLKNDHTHTWDYQDVDYEVLAGIISKQTHMSYNSYIHKNYTKPLKLRNIKDFSQVKQKEVPQPMDPTVDWHKVTVTTSSDFGAGNLFISPNDYWKFVYNAVLGNQKMLSDFYQQESKQRVAYFGGVYFNGDLIRADGSIPGYNGCFIANYKTKKMIMLFSNNIDYLKLRAAADDLTHAYLGE